ncbi:MAG: tetratricopeptide repeat protein [candidate division KSB1 bacterium]|nr:tetratricopeptide repeat protein [candidate division KSB1 bacterium]MDZ7333968.1 tetratricopeptide repeat protein [candidate division KSB1 bacterium]MDZ7356764.1 tetratricopeptide repeat protein [candidate division KSB1 bacterium]MDZ7376607.1 tetratricopeptide repeat protein [candidate division KSB1 bacterium]MDZ7399953.1 tetratricopeptide repeat protein [candidate division KSB1 bacterium]
MRQIWIFLIIVCLGGIIGCEVQHGTDISDGQIAELIQAGWEQFEAGNYTLGVQKFEQAISRNETSAEAYCGAGWCYARLTNLSSAVLNFNEAISLDASLVDVHAGLAFVYYAQKQYSSAISSANKTLSLSSNYLFAHDRNLSYKDLYLVIAACYFALGDFTQSLAFVKKLNPSFSADVATFDGKSALAEEIERLRSIV